VLHTGCWHLAHEAGKSHDPPEGGPMSKMVITVVTKERQITVIVAGSS
jgi:hypothetical protein